MRVNTSCKNRHNCWRCCYHAHILFQSARWPAHTKSTYIVIKSLTHSELVSFSPNNLLWGSLLEEKGLAAICSGHVARICPPCVRHCPVCVVYFLRSRLHTLSAVCPPCVRLVSLNPLWPRLQTLLAICLPCVCFVSVMRLPCVRHVPGLCPPRFRFGRASKPSPSVCLQILYVSCAPLVCVHHVSVLCPPCAICPLLANSGPPCVIASQLCPLVSMKKRRFQWWVFVWPGGGRRPYAIAWTRATNSYAIKKTSTRRVEELRNTQLRVGVQAEDGTKAGEVRGDKDIRVGRRRLPERSRRAAA